MFSRAFQTNGNEMLTVPTVGTGRGEHIPNWGGNKIFRTESEIPNRFWGYFQYFLSEIKIIRLRDIEELYGRQTCGCWFLCWCCGHLWS